jgi:hypothetical protein
MVTSKNLMQKYYGLWQMDGVYKSNKYGVVPYLKGNRTRRTKEVAKKEKKK